jgi:hypothetical protein
MPTFNQPIYQHILDVNYLRDQLEKQSINQSYDDVYLNLRRSLYAELCTKLWNELCTAIYYELK